MNEACEVENNVIVFRCKKFVLKYISERKMEDNNMISFASDYIAGDRKSTRLNSSHRCTSRMPSSA